MSDPVDDQVGYLTRDEVIEVVARAYFEHFFDDNWNNLSTNGIDRALHKQCAAAALDELAELLRQNPKIGAKIYEWFPPRSGHTP